MAKVDCLPHLREFILKDEFDELKQFLESADEPITNDLAKQLIISAIYSKRLDILEYLTRLYPDVCKRKGPMDYGDIISFALSYDIDACFRILKVKLERSQSNQAESDWNILHRWIVARWNEKENAKTHEELSPIAEGNLLNESNGLQPNSLEEKLPNVAGSDVSSTNGDAQLNNSTHDATEVIFEDSLSDTEENASADRNRAEEVLEALKEIISTPDILQLQDKTLNSARDDVGWTPLHLAALLCDHEACRLLIENGAPLNLVDYEHGREPVHLVAAYGNVELLKYFTSAGCSHSTLSKRGDTTLFTSIKFGNKSITSYLLTENIDPEEIDREEEGNTPILLAIKHSHPTIVKQLLKAGADPNREINKDMMTYLHYIASLQYCRDSEKEIAILLITYGGAAVDAKDRYGATPLHYALLYNRIEIAELLLRHNAIFTRSIIDLIRRNAAIQNLYLQLRQKKLTEHTAALIYPSDTLASYPHTLSGHTMAYTNIGEIFVFGGSVKGKRRIKHSNKLLKFTCTFSEGDHGTWTEFSVPDTIEKRSFHSCVYLNGVLWFYGGRNDDDLLDVFDCYNIEQQTWIDCKPQYDENGYYASVYPGYLSNHTAIISYRKEYTIEDIYENDCDEIRSKIASFKETRDPLMLYGLPDAPNVIQGSQKMVLYGGATSNERLSDSVWEYHFATREWVHRPAGPSARVGHTAIYDHNKNSMIIFGGYNGETYFNDCYDYSLWDYEYVSINTTSEAPLPRCGHAAVLTMNRMWIFGGASENEKYNDLWYLTLDDYAWVRVDITSKYVPRFNFTVNCINEKQIAIFGGDGVTTKNLLLVHLPEHHMLHERIFSVQPEEDGEYAMDSVDEDLEDYLQDQILENEDEIVRDAPTTEYF